MPTHDDPREARPEEFPLGANRRAQLRFLLHYAVLAPSSHNSQPWLFRLRGDALDVLADRTRGLPVVDPYDRALTISCGAAVGALEAAARRFGLTASVEPAPSPGTTDVVATVVLGEGEPPVAAERARFDALLVRRTDRGMYAGEPPPAALLEALADEAAALGVEIRHVAGEEGKARIAELVAEGDRRQFDDPRFRRELAAWVHSRRLGSRDGMSAAGFGMPDVLAPAARLAIRTFDMGDGVAAADAEKIRKGSPVLSVIATPEDAPAAWVDAGRALTRVLLALTAEGFSASYLNQPIETAELRPRLREVAGVEGTPQLLLRLGRGGEGETSARRPLAEVLVE